MVCLLDRVRELHERWQQRLTLDNLALAKRYLEGELRILLHLTRPRRDMGADAGAEEFCAVLQRELSVGRTEGVLGEGLGPGRRLAPLVLGRARGGHHEPPRLLRHRAKVEDEVPVGCAYRDEQTVLVHVVELGDPVERVVPSLVWLDRLDKVHRRLARALYFSQALGFKFLGSVPDGELGAGDVGPSVHQHELASQQIERGAEIVDDVADDGGPAERRLRAHPDAENPLAGLRIFLGHDLIGFGIEEGTDLRFKITDVLFGPFDLGTRSV